jgi:lauroyl/myristoyl acyltransferase
MKESEYSTEKNRLVEQLLYQAPLNTDDLLNRSLNFFSANISNFIPTIDEAMHESLFKQVLLHQKLSWLDTQYPDIFDCIDYEGLESSTLNLLKHSPTIICTFHLGSIRLLNYFLVKNKVKFSLVIADTALNEFGSLYQQSFQQLRQDDDNLNFNIISAQSPHSGMQMLRELKNGISLLLYIDGYGGAGDNTIRNDNLLKVNFLAETIYARKGVAYFSHLARVPIVVTANYRKSLDEIRFRFFEPIYPDLTMERAAYALSITQKIYQMFSELLLEYPGQWETWLYLHTVIKPNEFRKFLDDSPPNEDSDDLYFNKKKFGIFNIDQDLYLFNKRSYHSFRIDKQTFSLLNKAKADRVYKHEFPEATLNQLLKNNVLIY